MSTSWEFIHHLLCLIRLLSHKAMRGPVGQGFRAGSRDTWTNRLRLHHSCLIYFTVAVDAHPVLVDLKIEVRVNMLGSSKKSRARELGGVASSLRTVELYWSLFTQKDGCSLRTNIMIPSEWWLFTQNKRFPQNDGGSLRTDGSLRTSKVLSSPQGKPVWFPNWLFFRATPYVQYMQDMYLTTQVDYPSIHH